jgi:hypothetical protein
VKAESENSIFSVFVQFRYSIALEKSGRVLLSHQNTAEQPALSKLTGLFTRLSDFAPTSRSVSGEHDPSRSTTFPQDP